MFVEGYLGDWVDIWGRIAGGLLICKILWHGGQGLEIEPCIRKKTPAEGFANSDK